MRLSILIVNWRSKDYVRKCLASVEDVRNQLQPQVVVVDAGSMDGCGEMLADEFPGVEFVECENVGFGRANNAGFERIDGDVLLLLNPDTEVRPGAVQRLIKAHETLDAAGIVAPRLLNSDGTLQTSCVRALPTPLNRALDCDLGRRLFPRSRLWGTYRAFQSSVPVEIEAASGACLFMRSETFRLVNGFSPQFFLYGEDMDLCAKIGRLGLKVYHVPDAIVVHHGGGSSAGQAARVSVALQRESWNTYMQLNHGVGTARWYRLLQGVSAVVRLAIVLTPAMFWPGRTGAQARISASKWWYVFRWSVGALTVRP